MHEVLKHLPKTEAYMRCAISEACSLARSEVKHLFWDVGLLCCSQIAEARLLRLKVLNPNTPMDQWKLLSKRENLMIDAEDSQTQLFHMEEQSRNEASDLDLVQKEVEAAIVRSGSGHEAYLYGSKLNSNT